jgi:hypothetical protein
MLAAVNHVVKLLRTPMAYCLQKEKREAFETDLAGALETLSKVWVEAPLIGSLSQRDTPARIDPRMNVDPWLTSAEVEAEYKIGKATLCVWRAQRRGPEFRQVGRSVHYRKSVIDAFVVAQSIQTEKKI